MHDELSSKQDPVDDRQTENNNYALLVTWNAAFVVRTWFDVYHWPPSNMGESRLVRLE
jgi:hypothetical protein